jgi:hypothetical protein
MKASHAALKAAGPEAESRDAKMMIHAMTPRMNPISRIRRIGLVGRIIVKKVINTKIVPIINTFVPLVRVCEYATRSGALNILPHDQQKLERTVDGIQAISEPATTPLKIVNVQLLANAKVGFSVRLANT